MSLRVEFAPPAAAQVRALPPGIRVAVLRDVTTLADDPIGGPPRVKRLHGLAPPTYRLRSGSHRVIYRLVGETVVVLAVIDRKNLDRTIRRLR